ncbi:MAG: NAD(P)H-dependent oxidoreductase [Gordonia sp. (in: high G+C Gram-positive bacteria)]
MSDAPIRIAVLVGSLRRQSVNRRLAQVAVDHAPEGVELVVVDGLDDLPFYNEDVDVDGLRSPAVDRVRSQVGAADAVLLVTPEYNGTIPALLKNAIDWLSRPYGSGALAGLPVGVIGAALSRFAGTWSRQDARRSVGIAGANVVEDVEIGVGPGGLDVEGEPSPELVDELVAAVRTLAGAVAVAV